MTSRSEYRLLLREDNADRRLTPIGHRIGLISEQQLAEVEEKYARVDTEINRLTHTGVAPSPALSAFLAEKETADVTDGCRLIDLLRRPGIHYEELSAFDPGRPVLTPAEAEQVELNVKYEGYIRRQEKQVEDFRRMDGGHVAKHQPALIILLIQQCEDEVVQIDSRLWAGDQQHFKFPVVQYHPFGVQLHQSADGGGVADRTEQILPVQRLSVGGHPDPIRAQRIQVLHVGAVYLHLRQKLYQLQQRGL